MESRSAESGALIVFYSRDLEASEALVLSHGASIIKPIFDFPSGCWFQFAEPTGNEFTFWSNSWNTGRLPVV